MPAHLGCRWQHQHIQVGTVVTTTAVSGPHLSDTAVLAQLPRANADSVSSRWPLPRLMSMDSLLVCMLLTEAKPTLLPPPMLLCPCPCPPSVLSRLWAEELLKVVPQVRLLEGPVEAEYTEPGLEACEGGGATAGKRSHNCSVSACVKKYFLQKWGRVHPPFILCWFFLCFFCFYFVAPGDVVVTVVLCLRCKHFCLHRCCFSPAFQTKYMTKPFV